MSQDHFDIYFAGELLPEQDPQAVRQWLGAQFKLQGQALEQLFSGQPVRIKQGVDMDTAGRYRAAFRKAGALLEVRPAAATTRTPPASPPATPETPETPATPSTATLPELLPANTGSLEDCTPPVAAAPLPDISHMDIGSPDRPLDDTPPPTPADIDTHHLSAQAANSGDLSDCVQHKTARPIPDISRLELSDD